METRHAAIDGIGNLFKACTVPIIESACASVVTPLPSDTDDDIVSGGRHSTTVSNAPTSFLSADSASVGAIRLGSAYETIVTEREFMSNQLQKVLSVLEENLRECLLSTFGPVKNEGKYFIC